MLVIRVTNAALARVLRRHAIVAAPPRTTNALNIAHKGEISWKFKFPPLKMVYFENNVYFVGAFATFCEIFFLAFGFFFFFFFFQQTVSIKFEHRKKNLLKKTKKKYHQQWQRESSTLVSVRFGLDSLRFLQRFFVLTW
jgi:hypothetical protein